VLDEKGQQEVEVGMHVRLGIQQRQRQEVRGCAAVDARGTASMTWAGCKANAGTSERVWARI
jgi:hypothetical protein